jgi:tRNA dimethylallyltransferase
MRAVLIMGPTASGKSALAIGLAERLGGEIVNADAAQVYRDLRILSARAGSEDEARVPHHLFGHVDAAERYSTGKWLAATAPVIADIAGRGKTPIVVGGTGLYFKALTDGLAEAPPPDPHIRAELAARLQRDGAPSLYAELARVDPETATTLGPRDAPRIMRALEIWQATGLSIRALQATTRPALTADQWIGVTLWPERAELYARIEQRFAAMMEAGAVEEVRALMARGLDPDLPAMKAIGVPPLIAMLTGRVSRSDAIERAVRDTRRYAKRQYTWIRNQLRDWPCIEATSSEKQLNALITVLRHVDAAGERA